MGERRRAGVWSVLWTISRALSGSLQWIASRATCCSSAAGDPQHLAIFTGDTLIHSYASVGSVCEHRLASVWAARIVCAYRFREGI